MCTAECQEDAETKCAATVDSNILAESMSRPDRLRRRPRHSPPWADRRLSIVFRPTSDTFCSDEHVRDSYTVSELGSVIEFSSLLFNYTRKSFQMIVIKSSLEAVLALRLMSDLIPKTLISSHLIVDVSFDRYKAELALISQMNG